MKNYLQIAGGAIQITQRLFGHFTAKSQIYLPRIPKGFQPKAQVCEERATLGESTIQFLNRNGVVASSWPLSMLIVAFGLILTGLATAQTFTTLYSFSAGRT